MTKILENLEKINSVKAPEFLLTRIQQKIESQFDKKVEPKWVLISSFTLIGVLVLNIIAINSFGESPQANLLESFGMNSNNSLY